MSKIIIYKGRKFNNAKIKFADIKKAFPNLTVSEFEKVFEKKAEKKVSRKNTKKKNENSQKSADNTDFPNE